MQTIQEQQIIDLVVAIAAGVVRLTREGVGSSAVGFCVASALVSANSQRFG